MRKRFLGFFLLFIGIFLFALQYQQPPKQQEQHVYVYPQGAEERTKHGVFKVSEESQLIIDGCNVPHITVMQEVSEEEAKKMREEAGFSSDGVTGGIIVELKNINETEPCT